MLQLPQVQPELTVGESLEQFAGYYPSPRPIDETIALVGLVDQRDTRAGRLSGGQQRRLDLALTLIGTRSCSSWTSRRPVSIRRPDAEPGQ